MSDMSTGTGKVVVNRSMSLDGFIAGPGDAQDWIFDFLTNDPPRQKEAAAATGARCSSAGEPLRSAREWRPATPAAQSRGAKAAPSTDPCSSSPTGRRTGRTPDVTYLTGDIGEAVATAPKAAGGKDLQILGADVAAQCRRRGLVDEILVTVLPVLLGDGIRFSAPGLARIDLEPVSSMQADAVTILRFRVRK